MYRCGTVRIATTTESAKAVCVCTRMTTFVDLALIHEFGSLTGRITSAIDVFIITYFAYFTLNPAIDAATPLKIVDVVLCGAIALIVGSLVQLSRSWRLASLQRELIEVDQLLDDHASRDARGIAPARGTADRQTSDIWLPAAGRCYVSALVVMLAFRIGLAAVAAPYPRLRPRPAYRRLHRRHRRPPAISATASRSSAGSAST